MSDRIGNVPVSPNPAQGFEVVDASEFAPQGSGPTGAVPAAGGGFDDFSDLNLDEIKNEPAAISDTSARVSGGDEISARQKDIIKNSQIPLPADSFLHKVGRFFLNIANKIFGRVSNTRPGSDALDALRGKTAADLPALSDAARGKTFRMSTSELGKIAGLGNNALIKPFADYGESGTSPIIKNAADQAVFYRTSRGVDSEYGELTPKTCGKLFPSGEPRLEDIKQKASLQDCWFLSSVGAMLNSQGTHAISRLFSESETEGCVRVRLGNHQYEVPLGDLVNSKGERFGSNSANWVKALETAMLMHTFNTTHTDNTSASAFRFSQRNVGEALAALQGHDAASGKGFKMSLRLGIEEMKQAIRGGLEAHVPVVIGHMGSSFEALRDGVAPGHAVTVLAMADNGVQLLDPYGEVKTMSFDALTRCSLFLGDVPPKQ